MVQKSIFYALIFFSKLENRNKHMARKKFKTIGRSIVPPIAFCCYPLDGTMLMCPSDATIAVLLSEESCCYHLSTNIPTLPS